MYMSLVSPAGPQFPGRARAIPPQVPDDLWRPVSACGPRCRNAPQARAGRARQAVRVAAAALVLLIGIALPWRADLMARALLRAMGVRLRFEGPPIAPGALLVGNHVSWLDIVVVVALSGRARGLRMVAKSEVGAWPLIGRIARRQRTIFVDRARPRELPLTVAQAAAALRAGDTVQVFPEGTTTCGPHQVRWRSAFFQAALDAGAAVQPFTLTYNHPAASFIGDDTLIESLRRVLAARSLRVTVTTSPPERAVFSRRHLAYVLGEGKIHVAPR
ncbi:1-acyl-sn-glycerol-3-phosphate acyltransferase [Catellatospora sp. TT07R-123]|uniref:lysophospholipid acyltransferase family protein n=1 Tax=Catellatospora sp. TT07R-123 TaxID=2733863 RepID=UPI001B1A3C01|nr:lysophospholipid acyltransferase family protein [Catellatospora sp. TT07R-123]GHJ50102.1 1-acyl-sn-glycerol-3-phosphate acyltransferase [Catellatospora sp. TT07R-123]